MKKLSTLTIAALAMIISSPAMYSADQAEATESFVTAANDADLVAQVDDAQNWQGMYEDDSEGGEGKAGTERTE